MTLEFLLAVFLLLIDMGRLMGDPRVCGDMIAMGILDPAKVTRSALQNAASVASLMITTEVMLPMSLVMQLLLQCLIWVEWAV